MRLRLYESAIASCFVFSRKNRDPATFDFCNTIFPKADIKFPRIICRGGPMAFAPQKNSEPFRRRRAMKSVADLHFEA